MAQCAASLNDSDDQADEHAHVHPSVLAAHDSPLSFALVPSAPIMRLPSDLLYSIFIKLSAVSEHLLLITWLCAEFRGLALSKPVLWTRLDLTRPALAKLWIHRSKEAPLHIVASHTSHTRCAEMLSLTVPLTIRLASFDISITTPNGPLMKKLADILTCPAPILRSLQVKCLGHNGVPCTDCALALQLPSSGGGICVPHLSCLKLRLPIASPSWLSNFQPMLPSVVYLDIDNCHRRNDSKVVLPSLEAFLRALGSAPFLKVLRLRSCLPDTHSDLGRKLLLPKLIELSIAGIKASACSSFLGQLSVPKLSSIALSCDEIGLDWIDDEGTQLDEFRTLLSRIPLHVHLAPRQPSRLKIMSLTGDHCFLLSLQAWVYKAETGRMSELDSEPEIDIRNTWKNRTLDSTDLNSLVHVALRQLDWSQLRWLRVETTPFTSLNTTTLFWTLKTLYPGMRIEELEIVGGCAKQIIGVLGDTDHNDVPFHHLKRICIYDLDVRATGCYSLLLSALRCRARCGLLLQELVLDSHCDLEEEDYQKLGDFAKVVIC
ncbi:hypothetical protein VNI00_013461 [Paramarasmius palmivorus]|uniref:F-box domain-containing protein n=1 Tax=Paramarasmius palmivorus TaxID=297713 RepID=A0AAW0BZV5_9AGAR